MKSPTYVFDIETGPLETSVIRERTKPFSDKRYKKGSEKQKEAEEAYLQKAVKDGALYAAHGEVLAIGLYDGTDYTLLHGIPEWDMLVDFWDMYRDLDDLLATRPGRLIGYYCYKFDLPFLVQRSIILKATLPESIYECAVVRDYDRWWPRWIKDIYDSWLVIQRQTDVPKYIIGGLDGLSRILGVGHKTEDGKNFAALYKEDQERALAYLKNDLFLTWQCADRLGLVIRQGGLNGRHDPDEDDVGPSDGTLRPGEEGSVDDL